MNDTIDETLGVKHLKDLAGELSQHLVPPLSSCRKVRKLLTSIIDCIEVATISPDEAEKLILHCATSLEVLAKMGLYDE